MADANEAVEREPLERDEPALVKSMGNISQLPLPTVARLVQLDLAILSKLVRGR